jgi:hypothetical protein
MRTVSAGQFVITFLPVGSILIVIAVVSALFELRTSLFTRDVTAIAGIHPLSGFLSNLGILLWCTTASICLFAAVPLANLKGREVFRFLVSSGLLSGYLLLDDLFLIHETLAPRYVGVDERAIYVVLALAILAYLVAFRRLILRTRCVMLLAAVGLLAASVVIDTILEPWLEQLDHWKFLLEDGCKWLGIAGWCSYYVSTSHQLLVTNLDGAGDLTETTGMPRMIRRDTARPQQRP